jgi:hypothetical protein
LYTPPVTPWKLAVPEVGVRTEHSTARMGEIRREKLIFLVGGVECWVGAAEGKADDWGEVVTR